MNTENKNKRENVTWQLTDAKAMLSEVVKASMGKPQIITLWGRETAVILSVEEYKRLIRPKETLYEFIQNSPLRDFSNELPLRSIEYAEETNP